jgi:nicotinate phosphoribosyltransferase
LAETEVVTDSEPANSDADRPLLTRLVRAGDIVGREPIEAARARHKQALAELPPYALQLSRGYPAIATVFEPDRD